MDKTYYYKDGEKFGWLEFKEASVLKRETEAYDSLQKLGTEVQALLPAIDTKTAAPKHLKKSKDDKETFEGKQGYWVEHIPHDKTIKPKMCALVVPSTAKTVLSKVTLDMKDDLAQSLKTLVTHLSDVANRCGELSIAIHKTTGKAYLLDYAPDKNGAVGGVDLATTAGKGIAKMAEVAKVSLK